MRLTLHIGTTKTGSTSLQAALAQSRGPLRKAGVYYDSFTFNQNGLELLARDGNRLTREFRFLDAATRAEVSREAGRIVARLHKAATGRRYPDAVLSSEYLSLFNAVEVARLVDRLATPGLEIRAVCYVRRPSQHWLSLAQQFLKASSTFPAPIDYRYSVRESLEAWHDDPRVARVIVRPFDFGQLTDGSIVSDFVAHTLPAAAPLTDVEGRANERLSAEAAILQQRFRAATHPGLDNRFTPVGSRVLDAIEDASRHTPGTPLRAHQALLDLVDKQHVPLLRWLKATHGVDLVPADELDRLESTETDPRVGRETRVEAICTSFDDDILERLTFDVINRLASDGAVFVTKPSVLTRLRSVLRRRLARW